MIEKSESTSETGRNFSFRLCVCFLFCALWWNPGICTSPGQAFYLPFFTPGALCFAAAGILGLTACIQPMKKYMSAALIGFILLAAGQYLVHSSIWGITQLGESLFWVALPGLVYVYCREFRKLLEIYVLLVGGYALLYSAGADLRGVWSAGITGNVNWTAALFVITMIFLGRFIYERWKNRPRTRSGKMILTAGFAVELLLFRQLWIIGSKGAFLAAALTGLLFFWLRSGTKIRKIMIVGVLTAGLAGAFFLLRNPDAAGQFIHNDGRVIFWENAVSLIADHPFFGVGQGSFENEYMRYRKADYFFLLNPAARSNHPHNHLLFMAGSGGIIGLILWGILLLAPLAVMMRKHFRREKVDSFDTACFLTVCYALLHGNVDLILVSMPTSLIALMCLGILWRQLEDPARPEWKIPLRNLRRIAAAGLFGLSALIVWRGCHAALQVRRAYRNELPGEEILQTIKRCPGEYQSNFALLNYLEKRNFHPELSLAAADVMLGAHIPNYPGLHMGRGNALMRLGRFREALPDYQVEAELFPLTLRPVYNMIVAARALRDGPLAARLEEELRTRMRIRGNDEHDLRIILTGKNGAHYDLRPGEKPRNQPVR